MLQNNCTGEKDPSVYIDLKDMTYDTLIGGIFNNLFSNYQITIFYRIQKEKLIK